MKMCRQLSGKSYFYSSCFAFRKIQVLLRILQGSKESAIEEILVFHYVKKEERLKGKEKKKVFENLVSSLQFSVDFLSV